jgi:hypothetical protein
MADAPGGWQRHTAPDSIPRAPALDLSSSPFDAFAQHGVAVLPQFLSASEVAQLQQDYRQQKAADPDSYYGPTASSSVQELLRPRAEALMRQCDEATNGAWAPKEPAGYSSYFATQSGNADFPFHMDHDSFLMHQCHRHYVNLYVYVVKPDPTKSGLSLIPWSACQEHFGHLCPELEFSGAKQFAVGEDGVPFIRDDFKRGESAVHKIGVHFDEISQTPHMRAGDALLFRMDLFHQTQDTETERVALSLRWVDTTQPVTRTNFETMLSNPVLHGMLGPMRRERMAKIFAEKSSLTFAQMRGKMFPPPPSPQETSKL